MNMLNSHFRKLGPVSLPFQDRRKYMHTLHTDSPNMAEGYEDYRDIVESLCDAAQYSGTVHMTVDEKYIEPGMSQRRPGAHVDGRFMSEGSWGHTPGPNWLHYCNNIASSPIPRMAVIVAASVAGCIVYPGQFDGQPKEDGDLEHIRDQLPGGVVLAASIGYWLSQDCVHESIRFAQRTKRTFLRLALE